MYISIIAVLVCSVLRYECEGFGRDVAVGRRPVIPMHELGKRRNLLVDGNYRRSKDIRADVHDRRVEAVQWKEMEAEDEKERLERLHRQLRWLTVNSNGLAIY